MFSSILGWVLVVLGILSYASGLVVFIKEQFFTPAQRAVLPAFAQAELGAIAELVDKIATALEQFSKLSVPVQWALLGLVTLGVGAYLIATQPF